MKAFLLCLFIAATSTFEIARAQYSEANLLDPNMQPGPAREGGSLCTNGCPVGFGYGGLRVQPKYDQFLDMTSGPTTAIPVQGVDGTPPGQ
jgi:hypothetical protein